MNQAPRLPNNGDGQPKLALDQNLFAGLERQGYGLPTELDLGDAATAEAYRRAATSVMAAQPGTLSQEESATGELTDTLKQHTTTIAYRNGIDVSAGISVRAIDEDERRGVRISDFFSVAAARHHGLGRGLLEAALRIAHHDERWYVDMYVFAGNTEAIAWYEQWGFQLEATNDPTLMHLSLWSGDSIRGAIQRLQDAAPPTTPAP